MWPKTQRHRLWTRRACSSSSSPWGSPSFSASSPRIRSLALPQNRLSILCDCWYASEYILYQIDYQNCNCVWYKCTEHSSCNFALETLKWEILLKFLKTTFIPMSLIGLQWMSNEWKERERAFWSWLAILSSEHSNMHLLPGGPQSHMFSGVHRFLLHWKNKQSNLQTII